MTLGVAIIGCGLIGQKRAKALGSARLIACADIQPERSNTLGRAFNAQLMTQNWEEAVRHPDVNVVIVATTNDLLAEITQASVEAGKHVLVEKPAARNAAELEPVIAAAQRKNRLVHVGFNHRYHPALRKAREIIDAGGAGELMFVRGRYGHGGRLGYEKEWRANPEISGGGELIDQGVHLIDLSRWFLGDFSSVMGFAHTYFWQMPVDDNGFMILQTPEQQAAHLHVSCTEWKNLFSFEIYGRTAKLHIDGIGGSYGVERLAYYKMLPQMGPPETTIWEYPGEDTSWRLEFAEFADDITLNRQPAANLNDASAALKIVDRIYKDSGHDYRS
jgi:predicted dehydrogenase